MPRTISPFRLNEGCSLTASRAAPTLHPPEERTLPLLALQSSGDNRHERRSVVYPSRCLVLLTALLAFPMTARAESAEEMVSACREVADATVAGEKVEFKQDFASGLCWGAFASIQAAIVMRIADGHADTTLGVCAPAGRHERNWSRYSLRMREPIRSACTRSSSTSC